MFYLAIMIFHLNAKLKGDSKGKGTETWDSARGTWQKNCQQGRVETHDRISTEWLSTDYIIEKDQTKLILSWTDRNQGRGAELLSVLKTGFTSYISACTDLSIPVDSVFPTCVHTSIYPWLLNAIPFLMT